MGQIRAILLSFLLTLVGGAALPVYAQSGFAVQVAAVQTRAEAEALASNLRARGLSVYWVKAEVPGKGTYYRVRIGGQFADTRSATEFGQKLKTAGVIGAYAVFKYDAPTTALDEQATERPA
jgi:cell division septation protein DedD